jgi:methionyl-tRNA formyltransferase
MKIVFFGSPDFSVPFLNSLINDPEFEIQAVITQPDKPVGRKKELKAPPVKLAAIENDLSVLQPPTLKNNQEFLNLLQKLEPDFFVVIAYGKLLPEEYLEIPAFGAINVHASMLPKYRGASPIQSAILNDEDYTGLSIMHVTEELDKGDLYYVRKIPVEPEETADKLSEKISEVGSVILPMCLKDILDRILTPIPQADADATYCTKIERKDAKINPEKETAREIYNKYRAFFPWPGLYFNWNDKRIKVLKAKFAKNAPKVSPGDLKPDNGRLYMGGKEGMIELLILQVEGKKPMNAKDFINGFLRK